MKTKRMKTKPLAVVAGLAWSVYFGVGPAIYEAEKVNCTTLDTDFYYGTAKAECGNPAVPFFEASMIGSNSILPWLLK